MKKLSEKLASAGKTLLRSATSLLKAVLEYTLVLVTLCVLALGAMKLPEVQNKWLRAKVGSQVYMIQDSEESGGGTGFAVKAPSGKTYILTNDHVCGVSSDKRSVLVTGPKGSMRRNIIAHDGNSDLCLIEAMPQDDGLTVADSGPTPGDTITVVGHPRLMPTHVSHGEMLGTEDVTVLLGPISLINPRTGEEEQIDPSKGGILPSECAAAKNKILPIEIDMLFITLKVKLCLVTVKGAYNTAVTIHPGNSGSPAVNFWGNVTGVAFAGSGDTDWGMMVPLQDVKAFLKNY